MDSDGSDNKQKLWQGDASCFDRMYQELAPRVLGYLTRMTNSRSDAEDLTQETFLAAYAHRETYRGGSQPITWLLGIARRRLRDSRRTARLPTLPLPGEGFNEPAIAGHAEQVTDRAMLEWGLSRLPVAEREALILTAVQGLTCREAAQVLGEPVGTVKWRIHQATRSLRCLLHESEGGNQ